MRTSHKKVLMIILITMILDYLGVSFVTLQLNPIKWSELSRIIYVFVPTLLLMIIISETDPKDWE